MCGDGAVALFFFFQAEDGIRDYKVTGVQTCALPILLVLLDDGVPGRVELTGMIDVATRVVPAAVLSPTTKSADASVLLARALTPEDRERGGEGKRGDLGGRRII